MCSRAARDAHRFGPERLRALHVIALAEYTARAVIFERERVQRIDHHVYLIPGFFGFAYLGGLKYFAHVREVLQPALARRGIQAQIHYVRTRPTASLEWRTRCLADTIKETASDDAVVHLVGHSSGGLDARMLVSPASPVDGYAAIVAQVASVVTIATPHRGTPLAGLFTTLPGQSLLRLLSLVSVHAIRRGRLPMRTALRLMDAIRKIDPTAPAGGRVIDQLFEQVLAEFSPEHQAALAEFFEDVAQDQTLVGQLVPADAAVRDAALIGRPGVAEGSVVLRSNVPKMLGKLGTRLTDQGMHALFWWLHGQVGRTGAKPVSVAPQPVIAAAFGDVAPTANDGIVPTHSQVWGTVIHAARADHLDAIGHFLDPEHIPPHYDWLMSGNDFRRSGFDALWRDVANFLAI